MTISVDELKNTPSLETIRNVLNNARNEIINNDSNAKSLDLYTALINHTIIEVYEDLSDDLLDLLIDVLRTTSGLAILITRINALMIGDSDDGVSQHVLSMADVLCRAVGRVLSGEGPMTIHSRIRINEEPQFISLIYGSRIFSILSKVRQKIEKRSGHFSSEWSWLTDSKEYGIFVANLILQTSSVIALDKASKLGNRDSTLIKAFGWRLFGSSSTSHKIIDIFTQLRSSQQWHILSNVIIPTVNELNKSLEEKISIIHPFSTNHHAQIYEYPEKFGINDISLCQLTVKLAQPNTEMVKSLIKRWAGSELLVKHNPIQLQEIQTTILLLSLRKLNEQECKNITRSEEFLKSVSHRLSGLSSRVRLFGTVFAEELTKKANSPMSFKLETDIEEQNRLRALANEDEIPVDESSNQIDDLNEQDSDDEPEEQISRPVDLPVYAKPDDDEEDSDDDPTISQQKKFLPPVYIKDLISYIEDGENYDKQTLALTHGPTLIKRKRDFGREMEFHGKALSSSIANMKNNFDIKGFEQMQLQLLVETAKTASVGPHLARLLFSGDLSLQQRMVLLTSLALAVQNSDEKEVFASKQLPGNLHELFSDSNHLNKLTNDLKNASIQNTAEKVDELIGGPKILRISRQLANKRKGISDSKGQLSSETAAKYYFFPLIGEWYNNRRNSNFGGYSDLLVSHLFKTLAILTSKAVATDIPDMTSELFDMILSMMQAASNETVIMDAILTTLLVILQVNEHEFLISHWPTAVVQVKTWLEDSWQQIPDENVQQTAASVLYQLVEMIDKWQMKLIGII